MLFHSFFFILIFLPIAVVGWHFFSAFRNRAVSEGFMIAMSLWFYALFGWGSLALLLGCTALGFVFHKLLWRARSVAATRSTLAVAIAVFLGILAVYKIRGGALPVGLSFYLFQIIAFLVDRARGNLADISPREYFLYILYFPKLAQGPIALPEEIIGQFRTRKRGEVDREQILRGLLLFILGLAKKVLLADALAPLVDFGFAQVWHLDTATVLLVLLSYAFQLYFDFSGYCDMGLGISRMLGIELPVNFDMPFQAETLSDFWKRWHATLSRFLTRFVYIPLGGSRRGEATTLRNILVIFLLSGLWHGTGWTYLLWGGINGALVVGSRVLARRNAARGRTVEQGGRLRVMAAFLFTLVFFRSESVPLAFTMLRRACVPLYPGFLLRTASHLSLVELYPVLKALSLARPGTENQILLALWVFLLLLCLFLATRRNAREIAAEMKLEPLRAVGLGLLFAWSLTALNNVGSFLYFAY